MAGTLTCKELVEFLDAYLAGELPPEALRTFNEHLSLCPSCVSYTKSYQAAIRLGKAVLASGEDEPPADVPDSLVEAILAARSTSRPSKH
jgi:anti-sigma factor RsiW